MFLGNEFTIQHIIPDNTTSNPKVVLFENGEFNVFWDVIENTTHYVFLQQYISNGEKKKLERIIYAFKNCETVPRYFVEGYGNEKEGYKFFMVWNCNGIHGMFYSIDGNMEGENIISIDRESVVHSNTKHPHVLQISSISFVVVWIDSITENSEKRIYARVISSDGSKASITKRIDSNESTYKGEIHLEKINTDGFVIVYESKNHTNEQIGIF